MGIIPLVSLVHNAYAAKGYAKVYKVTLKKVELCTASTGVDSCEDHLTLGSGDKEINIASVNAGSEAASYGSSSLLPLGKTYTHMRVTISRKFIIKSESIYIGAKECNTIATTDGMYPTDEAKDKYTHIPVVAESGTSAEMNLYIPSKGYTRCDDPSCDNRTPNMAVSTTTKYARYQQVHEVGDDLDDHLLVYELTNPYTVTNTPPKINISFGTQEAVGAYEVNGNCQMWAEEPNVKIKIEEA